MHKFLVKFFCTVLGMLSGRTGAHAVRLLWFRSGAHCVRLFPVPMLRTVLVIGRGGARPWGHSPSRRRAPGGGPTGQEMQVSGALRVVGRGREAD